MAKKKFYCMTHGRTHMLKNDGFIQSRVKSAGRRTFAPGVRQHHVRDVVVMKEYIPSLPKKPRVDLYQEERRPPSKPVYKPETKPMNAAFIEKKPALNTNYKPAKDEWQALPQRDLTQRRTALQKQQPKKTSIIPAAKTVQKPVQEVAKEVPPVVKKVAQAVKGVPPAVKKVAPAVKEVPPTVKKVFPVVKEVPPTAKNVAPAVKEVPPAVNKVAPSVKEVPPEVKKVAPAVKETTPVVKDVTSAVKEATPTEKKIAPAAEEATSAVKVTPAVNQASSDKDGKKAPQGKKPTAKPNSLGQYVLDDLTSSVLNDELQQIMIKVWQELPDSPPTDAEDLVANRFRNEAGDDLQNALGLSVTTRLLNVHNPLYVKLLFSGKPESGCLQTFIRKYNITAFKRISDPHRDLFAAKFDDVADYDRLSAHSELKCGSATVTIIPCYKYLSCPPSVKTIYADTDKEAAKPAGTNSSPQKQAIGNKTEKTAQTAKIKAKDAKVVEKKVNAETVNNENKTITNKNAPSATNTENKPSETQVTDKESAPVKPKPDKVEATKEVPVEPKKGSPKKPKVYKKDVNDKSNKNSKQVNDDIDEMMVVDEMGEEDDEEMTDQDILALMSGGIVLDECSGSDDEK